MGEEFSPKIALRPERTLEREGKGLGPRRWGGLLLADDEAVEGGLHLAEGAAGQDAACGPEGLVDGRRDRTSGRWQ